ncbi:MAG: hypothetical protein KBG15_03760 [Kofleriaceae bacterium]|nr:hypothetical protein [Kofleriaceae bacterium]
MRALVVVALVVPACSDSSSKTPDAAVLDATVLDATVDAVTSACTGACRTLTAKAGKGLDSVAFDRAFYGYNGSNADPTSVRIELHQGGDATCPTMNSPTPRQTAIVSAIPVTSRTLPTNNLTAKVSYLDFIGTLSMSPIVRSTAVSLSAITGSFVATDLYVAFDINATLGEAISITGHVFAIHCASLDEMP